MIQWLKEKFEAWIGIIVVLTVILYGIIGGLTLAVYQNNSIFGFIIGAVLGGLFGIIFCVIAYGLIATVVYIANATDNNMKILSEIKTKLNDIESIKNQMSKLNEISSKLDSLKRVSTSEKSNSSNDKKNNTEKNETPSDTSNTVQVGNKYFAIKDSEPGKYFCPKCHAQVAESAFSCSNCNKSLVED